MIPIAIESQEPPPRVAPPRLGTASAQPPRMRAPIRLPVRRAPASLLRFLEATAVDQYAMMLAVDEVARQLREGDFGAAADAFALVRIQMRTHLDTTHVLLAALSMLASVLATYDLF